jgi:protein-S-isoprenylcysteine O-methyltransferase Ste14
MNVDEPRKLGWYKDWPGPLFLFMTMIGFGVSVYDFWKIQHLHFQLNIFVIIGILLIILGGTLRIICRKTLMKVGFTMVNSVKLQIVKNQRVITNGIYTHIRHPLYLGEMSRNLGSALVFSSFYGFIVMMIANTFLFIRIGIEERMLIEQFGSEYEEYKKKTKKLLPYIY